MLLSSGGSGMCKRMYATFWPKKGCSLHFIKKMHENSIFPPIRGGGGTPYAGSATVKKGDSKEGRLFGDSAVYKLLELTHDIHQRREDRKHTVIYWPFLKKSNKWIYLYALLQNYILNT